MAVATRAIHRGIVIGTNVNQVVDDYYSDIPEVALPAAEIFIHAICQTWEEACQAAESIPMNVWRRSASGEGPKVMREESLVAKKSAGDLGL